VPSQTIYDNCKSPFSLALDAHEKHLFVGDSDAQTVENLKYPAGIATETIPVAQARGVAVTPAAPK
jgi:hypothetical protein